MTNMDVIYTRTFYRDQPGQFVDHYEAVRGRVIHCYDWNGRAMFAIATHSGEILEVEMRRCCVASPWYVKIFNTLKSWLRLK